jgi:hypothetical protein
VKACQSYMRTVGKSEYREKMGSVSVLVRAQASIHDRCSKVGYANVGQWMHGPAIRLKETPVLLHDICGQEADSAGWLRASR